MKPVTPCLWGALLAWESWPWYAMHSRSRAGDIWQGGNSVAKEGRKQIHSNVAASLERGQRRLDWLASANALPLLQFPTLLVPCAPKH